MQFVLFDFEASITFGQEKRKTNVVSYGADN